ncbi:hypothetical protein ONE63_004817 [Megalurothrips usitatus]|uniref:Leucine-rich repeat and WD repeat-containing protein 1 WD domain-containing protein n=1 Tax=Megalurothrips usitatus TaxID=439358 RepID=A0AAV7X4R6_9NEOP|nr:hypothetical protein ONE63_004817 [Megalurothrips usitatus]
MEESGTDYFTDPKYEYEPTMFLKCHSKIRGDKNDRITKVWMCAFEPHLDYPEETTDLIASCGSSSVCVTNVRTEQVVMKHYSKESKEDFFALAWSSVNMRELGKKKKSNILAVAGAQCTLHLLHPSTRMCFFEEKFKKSKKVTISSLRFHSLATSVLCASFSSGEVCVWDIGVPSLPDYEMKLSLLHTLSVESEIINLSFSRQCSSLLAATDNGVVAWALHLKELNDCKSKIKMWRFNFPLKPGVDDRDYQLVDSVEPIQNGKIIASKCALHGNIYLWDLEEAIEDCMGNSSTVRPAHILNYSNTDNYFMSMGSSLLSGLLACGDDLGNIWLYDLKEVFSQSHERQEQSAVIPWPVVEEIGHGVVPKKEIVINKVVVDYKGNYIVAVTHTNLVCVWKKERL